MSPRQPTLPPIPIEVIEQRGPTLVEKLAPATAYAATQADFAGQYVDRAGIPTLVFQFHEPTEGHEAAIARVAPAGAAWRVESVAYSASELEAAKRLLEARADWLESMGIDVSSIGVDQRMNRTTIGIRNLTNVQAQWIESIFGPPVVAVGEPWLQPSASPTPLPSSVTRLDPELDYRILLDMPGGLSDYGVGVATDAKGFETLWSELDRRERLPSVDFGTDIVIAVVIVVSVDCPDISLVAIEKDATRGIVYGVYSSPGGPILDCSDVGAAHTFVVSVKRSVLPKGAFAVRVSRELRNAEVGEHPDETQVPAVR